MLQITLSVILYLDLNLYLFFVKQSWGKRERCSKPNKCVCKRACDLLWVAKCLLTKSMKYDSPLNMKKMNCSLFACTVACPCCLMIQRPNYSISALQIYCQVAYSNMPYNRGRQQTFCLTRAPWGGGWGCTATTSIGPLAVPLLSTPGLIS